MGLQSKKASKTRDIVTVVAVVFVLAIAYRIVSAETHHL